MPFDGGGFSFFRDKGWELALSGELEEYIKHGDEVLLKAARAAMQLTTWRAQARLRDLVAGSGLPKIANAIRADIYPKQGLARSPTGYIHVQPTALRIFNAFNAPGAVVKSKRGKFIAIPIPGSPADRKNFGRDPVRSQETKVEAFKRKGVQLIFVPPHGDHPAMLVAQSVRLRTDKRGRLKAGNAALTKSGGFAKGAASVPLFWLVPEAKMPAKFNWTSEAQRIMADFLNAFAAEFKRQLGDRAGWA